MDDIPSSIPSSQPFITPSEAENLAGVGSVSGESNANDQGVSTLSPSQQSIEDAKKAIIAGSPLLIPPIINFTTYQDFQTTAAQNISLAGQLDDAQNTVIQDMLDKWSESIDQIKEQMKEEDKKKIMSGNDPATRARIEREAPQGSKLVIGDTVDTSAYLQSLPPITRLDLISDIISSYKAGVGEKGAAITPAIALGLVFSSIAILQTPMATTELANVKPIQDAFNTLPQQMFPGDMRAELGLLGTFMLTGIVRYTALGDAESQGAKKGAPLSPQERANTFAQGVITNINAPDFNALLSKIITAKVGKDSPLADQMSHIFKLRVLSVALAALYKTEGMYKVTSNITPQEFAGMLDGTIKFPDGDIRNKIIEQIHGELAAIEDPNVRESEVNNILNYLNSNPSVDDLVQGGIFASVSDTSGAAIPS